MFVVVLHFQTKWKDPVLYINVVYANAVYVNIAYANVLYADTVYRNTQAFPRRGTSLYC